MQNDEALPSGTPIDPVEQILAQRKAFETAVTLRAWSDAAFAEQLAQDPVAAINAAFNIELPADLDIQLHHETSTTLHLTLPPMPVIPPDSDELSEDDLERVAGGATYLVVTISITSATVSATATSMVAVSVGTATGALVLSLTNNRK